MAKVEEEAGRKEGRKEGGRINGCMEAGEGAAEGLTGSLVEVRREDSVQPPRRFALMRRKC